MGSLPEQGGCNALRGERSSRKQNHLYYTTMEGYMKTIKTIANIIMVAVFAAMYVGWIFAAINNEPWILFKVFAGCLLAGLLLGAAEAIYNAGRRDEYNRRNYHE